MPAINPFPSPAGASQTVREWAFTKDTDGWKAEHDCEATAADGLLKVRSTGDDPYLHVPLNVHGGPMVFEMKARGRTGTGGAVYWATDRAGRSEQQAVHFALIDDGQWHEYIVRFTAAGRLTDLRLDPGSAAGEFDVEWMRLSRQQPHPLAIEKAAAGKKAVRFTVKNGSAQRQEFSAHGQQFSLDAGKTVEIERPVSGVKPVEAITLAIESKGFPPLNRTAMVCPDVEQRGEVFPLPAGEGPVFAVTGSGTVVTILWRTLVVARIAPLVHRDGELPKLKRVGEGFPLRYEGDGVAVTIAVKENEISIIIDSQRPCEGPVVRPVGAMRHAVFAGLEYLSQGETSSSKLDIESEGHLRYAPDPLKVTLPLMSIVTEQGSVAMTWTDMSLQPVFATPNFFDGTSDHRMALRGKHIEAAIRISKDTLEDNILWAVKRRTLPPLPKEPRTKEEQRKLCLAAFSGPLRNEKGWGHCVEANWARHPFADIASAWFRLSGEVPKLDRVVPGGGHVRNECIYFLTGRAEEWLRRKTAEAQHLLKEQQPDGSFRYTGPYRRGHFEDTASGVCAQPAAMLLEFARLTGDKPALEAGIRTLEYMKRFCVPRGAQVWELSMHTPDQLASAYLVWAYVRGYELTGKKEYLAEARRWALSGVPFVYLWGRYPMMPYSTIAVYGATNWTAPDWMGLPVQWVGGVYAYSLTLLAPYDPSLDWKHLARGILISAEQQQYPDGPDAGLLPDSLVLDAQRRQGPKINPSAIAGLRMVLDGELDSLAVAIEGPHRIVAPFPVTLRDGKAHVRAKAGVTYQVVIDAKRVVKVKSKGEDIVPLEY
jgi:hypothetical protein